MGKHTKRKPGRLPKVAAGAAPVALLIGAPASAFAAQTDLTQTDLTQADLTQPDITVPLDRLTLPIDHHQDGRISRELTSDAEDGASVLRGSLDVTRHDVVGKNLGDAQAMSDLSEGLGARYTGRDTTDTDAVRESQTVTQGQKHALRLGDDVHAVTAEEQRLGRSGSHTTALSMNDAKASEQDEKLLGGGESTRHGLWLPRNSDVLSQNSEQVDSGIRRSAALDGSGRFAGDLGAALAARRSSGQAVDLGDTAAAGIASDQSATGQTAGSGSLSGSLDELLAGEYAQTHAVGGHAGPAFAMLSTGQDTQLHHEAQDVPGNGDLTDSISGDLGIEDIAAIHGGTTTAMHGELPDPPSVTQDQSASAGVLGRPPVGTAWTVSEPPLDFRPH